MKKWLTALLIILVGLLNPIGIEAQDNTSSTLKMSLGISMQEEEKQMWIDSASQGGYYEFTDEDVFIIDGNLINKYLEDGSNESTGVYSSAQVFLNWTNGVQVDILTPAYITQVSESAYENAAIAAGAKNAYIQIFSPLEVTGEGALVGVYEIFSQSGMELDIEAIRNAERQIGLEQTILSNTDLSEDNVSRIITALNYETMLALESKDSLEDSDGQKIVTTILNQYGHDFPQEIQQQLVAHIMAFSQTNVAKDTETKSALELRLQGYEAQDSIYEQTFETVEGKIKIDRIVLLDPTNDMNSYGEMQLGIWYTVTNTTQEKLLPIFIWFSGVDIAQDNTTDYFNILSVGSNPDLENLDRQNIELNPGGTMQFSTGYLLGDMETPVTLRFYKDYDKEEISGEVQLNLNELAIQ